MFAFAHLLLLLLLTSACATIIDGQTQTVSFNSSPSGARVSVNGMDMGSTPLTVPIKRSKTAMVSVQKNGYEGRQLFLQTKMNMWFWGNIILGGVYGSTTDYASDAVIEYSPNMYHVTLNPLISSSFETDRPVRTRLEPENMGTEKQVRKYLLRNYEYLLSDISRGRGEYLSGLYALLQLPNSTETLKQFKSLASRQQEAPVFAEAVLKQFYKHADQRGEAVSTVLDRDTRERRSLVVEER